jgi:hypothetical protein
VSEVTGRPTFIKDSNFTQPSDPYCTVKAITDQNVVHDQSEIISDTQETVEGRFLVDFSIQAIGGNFGTGNDPADHLKKLVNSTRAEKYILQLDENQIYYSRAGAITDISTKVGETTERRETVLLTFYVTTSDTFDIDTSKEAEVTLKDEQRAAEITFISPPEEPICPN